MDKNHNPEFTCMKLSNGFTDLKFSVLTILGMIVSFVFLAQATKVLPLGTAYAVWTGIGALGALIVGILFFKEPATAARIFFAALLLVVDILSREPGMMQRGLRRSQ